jgi:hypothetical protein
MEKTGRRKTIINGPHVMLSATSNYQLMENSRRCVTVEMMYRDHGALQSRKQMAEADPTILKQARNSWTWHGACDLNARQSPAQTA